MSAGYMLGYVAGIVAMAAVVGYLWPRARGQAGFNPVAAGIGFVLLLVILVSQRVTP